MGRWSARRRSGGSQSLNFMVFADGVGTNFIEVNYLNPTNVNLLSGSNFLTVPGGFTPIEFSQVGDVAIEMEFAENITSETAINYTGTIPSILNPQTQPILP